MEKDIQNSGARRKKVTIVFCWLLILMAILVYELGFGAIRELYLDALDTFDPSHNDGTAAYGVTMLVAMPISFIMLMMYFSLFLITISFSIAYIVLGFKGIKSDNMTIKSVNYIFIVLGFVVIGGLTIRLFM